MGMVFKRIFNEGVQERPFTAHKRYEVTNVNHSSSFEISVLRGISDNNTLTEVSTSVSGDIGLATFLTSSGGVTNEFNRMFVEVDDEGNEETPWTDDREDDELDKLEQQLQEV